MIDRWSVVSLSSWLYIESVSLVHPRQMGEILWLVGVVLEQRSNDADQHNGNDRRHEEAGDTGVARVISQSRGLCLGQRHRALNV